MKYYYDVILNFSDKFLYFYEWNKNDSFDYVSKTPIFRLKSKDMENIKKFNIVVNKEFLELIKDRTLLKDDLISSIPYACIFTDSIESIAVEFDKSGKSIGRSKFLLEDDINLSFYSSKMSKYNLKYSITSKVSGYKALRQLEEKKDIVIKNITDIYNNNENDKLIYFYMKIFDEYKTDLNYIYKKIVNKIKETDNYDFFKMMDDLIMV